MLTPLVIILFSGRIQFSLTVKAEDFPVKVLALTNLIIIYAGKLVRKSKLKQALIKLKSCYYLHVKSDSPIKSICITILKWLAVPVIAFLASP